MPLDATATAMAFADLPNRAQAAHLLDKLDAGDVPRPVGYNVMLLQYVRPDKVGSLIMPAKVQTEDEFQNCIGFVLACGPDAYGDKIKFPNDPWVKPGDWVMWPRARSSVSRIKIKGVVLAFMPDDAFNGADINPELPVV